MKTSNNVLDVRSMGEFMGGHVAGSINIPLSELPHRLDEVKKLPQPLILCCASGMRSAQAASFLQNQGIKCENGGGWMDVNYQLQNQ